MVGDNEADAATDVLGSYIRSQRQLAEMSLRQLAQVSSVSNAYLSQIERGLHKPSIKVLRSIADALNVSGETLLAQAGLVDAEPKPKNQSGGVEAAIGADERLSQEQKRALVGIYRQFLQVHES